MKTYTRYFVRIKGEHSSFSDFGYSKYCERISLRDKGKIRGLVYGPAQCRDHITELRRFVYDRRTPYAKAVFEIVRVVTTEKVTSTNYRA